MDILAMIQAVPGVGPYLPVILMVFGICAVVAAQLPPPLATGWRSGPIYLVAYQVINLLAHNYNQAANIGAPTIMPAKVSTTVSTEESTASAVSSVPANPGSGKRGA